MEKDELDVNGKLAEWMNNQIKEQFGEVFKTYTTMQKFLVMYALYQEPYKPYKFDHKYLFSTYDMFDLYLLVDDDWRFRTYFDFDERLWLMQFFEYGHRDQIDKFNYWLKIPKEDVEKKDKPRKKKKR